MKHFLTVFFLTLSMHSQSQNLDESNITVQLTQRSAYWIATWVRTNFNPDVRTMPEILAPYVGSGIRPDSTFTVTLPAKFINGMIELLFSTSTATAIDDYNSILSNVPAVSGYTGLAAQVTTIAAGNGPQKVTAQYIVDNFVKRKADFERVRTEYIKMIVNWTKQ